MSRETIFINHIQQIKNDFVDNHKDEIRETKNLAKNIQEKLYELENLTIGLNKEIFLLHVINTAVNEVEGIEENILSSGIKEDYLEPITKRLALIREYCDFYNNELVLFCERLKKIIRSIEKCIQDIESAAGSDEKATDHTQQLMKFYRLFLDVESEIIYKHESYLKNIQNFVKHLSDHEFNPKDINYRDKTPEENLLYSWTEKFFGNRKSLHDNEKNDPDYIFNCALDATDAINAEPEMAVQQIQTSSRPRSKTF